MNNITMKSNKWRKIIIKNPRLQQVRKNLRTILTLALDNQIKDIRKIEDLNFQRYMDQVNEEYTKQGSKIEGFNPKGEFEKIPFSSNDLMNAHYDSILLCSTGTPCYSATNDKSFYDISLDIDMVWNPIDKHWICINCYNELFGTETLKNAYQKFLQKYH